MDSKFLKEALFSGMTSNAFKLGTVLAMGWFWVRRKGCSVLYRGNILNSIDLQNILGVFEPEAKEVQVPQYVQHEPNQVYFYLVRRVNSCGYCQWGLQAISRVSIDSEGGLSKPRPNGIVGLKADRTTDKKVGLVWGYYPIEQEIEPASFKIYTDDGSGGINYDNAVATIKYEGRGFYGWTSDELNEGKKSFAVRAVSEQGMKSSVSVTETEADYQAIEPPAVYSVKAQ